MKRPLFLFPLFIFAVSAVKAADMSKLESVRAFDIKLALPVTGAEMPIPAVPGKADPVPQDLLAKFNSAANRLSSMRNDLTWISSDLDNLESKARQMIQVNSADPFFQMDLRRMSSDMTRRVSDIQSIAADIKSLLTLAQKSPDLNAIARNMDMSARDILSESWPGIEDSSQRLEWTVRSGKPELVGYDAQWTAMDISRAARDFNYQARNIASDTQSLANKTQPAGRKVDPAFIGGTKDLVGHSNCINSCINAWNKCEGDTCAHDYDCCTDGCDGVVNTTCK